MTHHIDEHEGPTPTAIAAAGTLRWGALTLMRLQDSTPDQWLTIDQIRPVAFPDRGGYKWLQKLCAANLIPCRSVSDTWELEVGMVRLWSLTGGEAAANRALEVIEHERTAGARTRTAAKSTGRRRSEVATSPALAALAARREALVKKGGK